MSSIDLFGDREERIEKRLKIIGKTRDELNQNLKIMKDWLKTQAHLPQVASNVYVTL